MRITLNVDEENNKLEISLERYGRLGYDSGLKMWMDLPQSVSSNTDIYWGNREPIEVLSYALNFLKEVEKKRGNPV